MTETREFTITRTLDAPRERVFRAWTEPEHLRWFFSDFTPADEPVEVDLRVGGTWRQRMIIADDTEYVTGGVYREIVPVERLVFTWGAVDGWPEIDPSRLDDAPVATVLLDDVDGKTEMTFRLALPLGLSEESVREWFATGIREGWTQTIDRLVVAVATAPVGD
jgi:uncharacterized protein YndB with AHSA1/START domain